MLLQFNLWVMCSVNSMCKFPYLSNKLPGHPFIPCISSYYTAHWIRVSRNGNCFYSKKGRLNINLRPKGRTKHLHRWRKACAAHWETSTVVPTEPLVVITLLYWPYLALRVNVFWRTQLDFMWSPLSNDGIYFIFRTILQYFMNVYIMNNILSEFPYIWILIRTKHVEDIEKWS